MSSLQYFNLSSLNPVEIHYRYNYDESLVVNLNTYSNFNYYAFNAFKNYQDISINRGSCLVLTAAISLSSIFQSNQTPGLGLLPGTIQIQPRNKNFYYSSYDVSNNIITLALNGDNIFVNPIGDNGQCNLLIGSYYLQVDASYPYLVRASVRPLQGDDLYRQIFYYTGTAQNATLGTNTVDGFRYLAFSSDNILRATGLNLVSTSYNDYVFNINNVTNKNIEYDYVPNNCWVTYYLDSQDGSHNSDLTINKKIDDQQINYLIDFPYEEAINTGKAYINIASLKTSYTPAGGPAPVDNSYIANSITSN